MNIFNKKHNFDLYNTFLFLSRNIFFYKKINLPDNFETRIYLMFFHFSILMIAFKKRGQKFDQKKYDDFFHSIENDLRELGLGDVSVNKKMKELNKILYDILLKIEMNKENENNFKLNNKLLLKYFDKLKLAKSANLTEIETYFNSFFNFCFELSIDNMIEGVKNFKY